MKCYFMPHAPVFLPNIAGEAFDKIIQTYEALDQISREIAVYRPDTIVIISPHGPRFSDVLGIYNQRKYEGDLLEFGDYENHFKFHKDEALIAEILKVSETRNGLYYNLDDSALKNFDLPRTLDHGVLVPMYFVQKHLESFKVVCLSDGPFAWDKLIDAGSIIRKAAENLKRKIIVIASGDLSHTLSDQGPYQYHNDGPTVDKAFCDAIENQCIEELVELPPLLIENAGICGLGPLMMLMGIYEHKQYVSQLRSYQGPFGVGYAVCTFEEQGELEGLRSHRIKEKQISLVSRLRNEQHPYAQFAYRVLKERVDDPLPPVIRLLEDGYSINGHFFPLNDFELNKMMQNTRNIFVSIKSGAQLRGCIGCIDSDEAQPLYQKIAYYTWQAARYDPRFSPIEREELPYLTVSIDILSDFEEISGVEDLDPSIFGLLVTDGTSKGVLLPDIEGVEDSVEQIRIAAQKAAIPVDKILKMFRFSVDRLK